MFPANTIARKLLMAFSGQLMVLFAIFHVLGNSTIYYSGLNAYAATIHAFPPFLWCIRLVMLLSAGIHIYLGIVLTIENRRAKPQLSVVKQELASTFAGRSMIWTGSTVAAFLVYHLLHFTIQAIDSPNAAMNNPDGLGRPDVFLMVSRAFGHIGITAFYLAGVAALLLHLVHGIQSSFQTWGLNSERTFPFLQKGGTVMAILLFLAYAAIPVAFVAGILN